MIRRIAKVFAAAAVALSILLVADSLKGLSRPSVEIAATAEVNGR